MSWCRTILEIEKKRFESDKKPFLVSHVSSTVSQIDAKCFQDSISHITIWYNMNFYIDILKNAKLIIILKQTIIQFQHRE